MSRFLDITLPHPHRALRPNGRAHWAERARRTKKAKFRAWLKVRSAGTDAAALRPVRYAVTWFFRGAAPDADNCLASCKAYLDGCCDALGVNDRVLDCAGIHRVKDREQEGTVLIRFY